MQIQIQCRRQKRPNQKLNHYLKRGQILGLLSFFRIANFSKSLLTRVAEKTRATDCDAENGPGNQKSAPNLRPINALSFCGLLNVLWPFQFTNSIKVTPKNLFVLQDHQKCLVFLAEYFKKFSLFLQRFFSKSRFSTAFWVL